MVSIDEVDGPEVDREFDIIIFGTGFNVASYLEHEKIIGIGGLDLQQKWKEHPQCLYGMSTAQFPNLFMIFGPNSATVWIPPQSTWCLQAELISKVVKEIAQNEKKGYRLAMCPDLEVEREYNIRVQETQKDIVWQQSSCVTYYKNDAGINTFAMGFTVSFFVPMLFHDYFTFIPTVLPILEDD